MKVKDLTAFDYTLIEHHDDGKIHVDSVNRKTGGGLDMMTSIRGWLCMGHLIALSPQFFPDDIPEEHKVYIEKCKVLAKRIEEAIEHVSPGYLQESKMSNVGPRYEWEE